tara:strand:+ start:9248 stop:9730 length:483 start_codon:yes stop_codon:yes gene_type:complete
MQNVRLKSIFSLVVVFIVILFDYYTKQYTLAIDQNFVLNSFITIHKINNFGIAFGLFDDLNITGFLVLNILIIFILIFIAKELYYNLNMSLYYITGYSLILGGGISNLIDRFDNGSVTDFIILHYEDIYFPAVFNIADLSISLGAIYILFYFLRNDQKNN